jgi:hypothetical protein
MGALALLLVASAAAVRVAAAQTETAPWHVTAAKTKSIADPLLVTDRDADGQLNWEEFRNLLAKLFSSADRDGDQILAGGEIGSLFTKTELTTADKNKDGKVQEREFFAYAARVFLLTDADHNGSLTPKEIHREAAKEKS